MRHNAAPTILAILLGGGGFVVAACSIFVDTDGLVGNSPPDSSVTSDTSSSSSSSSGNDPTLDGSQTDTDAGSDANPTTDASAGLVAHYTFDETTGLVVHDSVAPALDLTLPTNGTSWSDDGALKVSEPSVISSGPATKIFDAIEQSLALSIEAWVEPTNLTQGGPARIVTLSPDPDSQRVTFVLGQEGNSFIFRTRSHDFNTLFAGGRATLGRHHIVGVADDSNKRAIFVDGEKANEDTLLSGGGVLPQALRTTPLTLANEPPGNRTWLGRILSVSVFSRVLSPEEISARFEAGPL